MNTSSRPGALSGIAAFVIGVALGVAVLLGIMHGPWHDSEWARYVEHPVEMAEVVMFCVAMCVLAGKFIGCIRERRALGRQVLPAWHGKPAPASSAAALRKHLSHQPRPVQATWLGRRVANVLDFVQSRGAAHDLDDQLRSLADNDAMTQDASYSLLRFITWAIPILGFLGTVIGITDAVAGVTPETLEQSLNGVTSGLATAFDTTALALLLTMILMFFTFLCERMEQSVLAQVDAYVDAELSHRFERTGPETSPILDGLRQGSEGLLHTAQELVTQQAALWRQSLEAMEERWSENGSRHAEQIQQSLELALDAVLTRHAQQMRQTEEKFLARTQTLLEGLTVTSEKLRLQAGTLQQLQENETQLLRLQETLNNNLAAVANTAAFDEAVHSLTAAIHLLTARANPGTPRLGIKSAA